MPELNYLQWLAGETATAWWHDSADLEELSRALEFGVTGVTTNPVLMFKVLNSGLQKSDPIFKSPLVNLNPEERAEELIKNGIQNIARVLEPEYKRSKGKSGYVCAQVNPGKAADATAMIKMAKRFHAWAPNIAVKLPVTAAGLDALEECSAGGITVAATVGFTVPQVIAVAERYRRGLKRAQQAGKKPGPCYAVIMIGRLDDYLHDVAKDNKTDVSEN